jgi:hypothetical protein
MSLWGAGHYHVLSLLVERLALLRRKGRIPQAESSLGGRSLVPSRWQPIALSRPRTSTRTLNSMADLHPAEPVIVASDGDNLAYPPPEISRAPTAWPA